MRALLGRAVVVTLTGVGGVGKTRLALAVAAGESLRRAAVCELGAVEEPRAVPFAVAEALGFPSLEAALVACGDEEILLVVDNCEHVLEATAAAVSRLTDRCAGVGDAHLARRRRRRHHLDAVPFFLFGGTD